MKAKKKLVGILAVTMLTNAAMPVVYAANETEDVIAPVQYLAQERAADEANAKLDYLGDLIEGLEKIAGDLTGSELGWLKELKNAFDFISKIMDKGIGSIAELRTKIIPRLDLLINVAETITADATELVDSEQQAHVIVGFSVTRALLKATDLFETADGLNKASEDLTAALDRARQVPKQTEDSVRTHYNLDKLNRAINNAKNIRNRELRNKLDPTQLAEVDMVIRKADDVRRNNRATVKEVEEATQELNAKIEEAYAAIPEGERAANNSTKLQLEKDIQIAKNLRDFKLKGNVDSSVIKELNREIAMANRVLKNNRSTVNQVLEADKAIVESTNVSKDALNAKEETEASVEEETETPVVEEETEIEDIEVEENETLNDEVENFDEGLVEVVE
ncbi:CAMP factor family pore-forming toxin [Peptoniphilus phoceensis]|uniref:CAMP factor family pore-forming toxin n=1 Tax=Peptoniphilus phoceensis TaxID=1720298 RepID=UPI0007863157|nr:CAMP factor family pore-forming toxin [Peptoniphilus phoceensis]